MLRSDVCQRILDLFPNPRYLEIGVHSGDTFDAVKASEKVAVDPDFQFDVATAAAADPTARYHAVYSDEFFSRGLSGAPFDVAFIDGLHTFEQVLRDLMNVVACTRPDSVIILDDVLPNGHCAAIADPAVFQRVHGATREVNGAWMGDVYRLVFFIAAFMPMWSYATVAENHGQLVMWRSPRTVDHLMSVEATARVSYVDVVLDRSVFRIRPFADIHADIVAWRARGGWAA